MAARRASSIFTFSLTSGVLVVDDILIVDKSKLLGDDGALRSRGRRTAWCVLAKSTMGSCQRECERLSKIGKKLFAVLLLEIFDALWKKGRIEVKSARVVGKAAEPR